MNGCQPGRAFKDPFVSPGLDWTLVFNGLMIPPALPLKKDGIHILPVRGREGGLCKLSLIDGRHGVYRRREGGVQIECSLQRLGVRQVGPTS